MLGPSGRERIALGLLLVLFGSALLADRTISAWALRCRAPLLDVLVAMINPIGAGVTLLIGCVALAVLARRLQWARVHDAAWLAALAFTASGAVEFTLKHLVGRPRPDAPVTAGLLGPSFAQDVDSFPSGHATSTFAVATIFAAYYPRFRWAFYGLATAIALGRVYLERHYASDVIAGATIGAFVAVRIYRHRRRLPDGMILEAAALSR